MRKTDAKRHANKLVKTCSKFRFILFDLDGTLTDPFEGISKSIKYALNRLGEPSDLPDETIGKFIGPPLQDGYMQVLGFPAEKAARAVEIYRERYNAVGKYENVLIPGVKETLSALKAAGCRLAVSTLKPEPLAEDVIRFFGLTELFDNISGALWQPSPDNTKTFITQKALRRLNAVSEADKAAALLVGDRHHDVEGAHNAGIFSVGALFGYGTKDELLAAGADFLIARFPDLLKIVEI
jgi:phosphoglycolate phosphatase